MTDERGDVIEMRRRQEQERQKVDRGAAFLDKQSADTTGKIDIDRLAALSPLEYDKVRETEAERMGVRVSTLDKEVGKARHGKDEDAAGKPMAFDEAEPWAEPVDGAELLDELSVSARRFLALPDHADVILALWAVFTYLISVAHVSPILAITAPEKRCGKTTVLHWLFRLIARALPASNITASALFRAVEKWSPSLLIDEADTFLKNSDELRGIINSGHTRQSAYVIRTVGDDHEPRCFTTWAAKAIAMIGSLFDTMADRSINIVMRRKLLDEQIDSMRDAGDHFEVLKSKIARWATDHIGDIEAARPDIPHGLHDRAADNWSPLLAIADCAGGEWPTKARRAAVAVSGSEKDDNSARVTLLGDIRALFEQHGTDRLSSSEIVEALIGMEDRPWPEWRHGKPLTQRGLAKLLEPFNIKPKQTRFQDGRSGISGYRLEAFTDVFRRYLSASSTSLQPAPDGAFSDFQSSTVDQSVELPKSPKPAPDKGCRAVEDESPVDSEPHHCPACGGDGCGWCGDTGRNMARESI